MTHDQKCFRCHKIFSSFTYQSYCSTECKKAREQELADNDAKRKNNNPPRICKECNKEHYLTCYHNGDVCSEACRKSYKGKIDGIPCKFCGNLAFTGKNSHEFCNALTKKKDKVSYDKEKEKIDKANKNFLEGKSKYARGKKLAEINKKNGHTLQKAQEKMEYKRVMSDSGWRHFIKGREWDRI